MSALQQCVVGLVTVAVNIHSCTSPLRSCTLPMVHRVVVVAVWRCGNVVGHINEVTLRRAWLVLLYWDG